MFMADNDAQQAHPRVIGITVAEDCQLISRFETDFRIADLKTYIIAECMRLP